MILVDFFVSLGLLVESLKSSHSQIYDLLPMNFQLNWLQEFLQGLTESDRLSLLPSDDDYEDCIACDENMCKFCG